MTTMIKEKPEESVVAINSYTNNFHLSLTALLGVAFKPSFYANF